MTAAIEAATKVDTWRLRGRGAIDDRPPAPCVLRINADGTWSAEIATFTFAGDVDLLVETEAGGHFCGPAFVERSRADSDPLTMRTVLTGTGPLLMVAPGHAGSAVLPTQEILDAEEVE